MPGEDLVPKGKVAALEKQVSDLEDAVAALLVAIRDVQEFTGREHMPEGEFLGEKF